MNPGIIGKKIGMSQVFTDSGKACFDKRRLVEKHFAAVRIGNKSKTSVANQFLYFTFMHGTSPLVK